MGAGDYKPIGKPNPEKTDDFVPKGDKFPTDTNGGMRKAAVNLPKERQNSNYFVTRKP